MYLLNTKTVGNHSSFAL